ncbi:MAG: hypothetical protein ABIG08_00830 [bacterium]
MIIGHRKQWEFLKKIAERKSFSHAYLFSGQEKLGKRKIALKWLSLLFQEDLENSHHPDLSLISPLEPDSIPASAKAAAGKKALTGKREIQIGQIRELIWKLSLKPYSAPLKAAVIDQAHLMNQEAQTSLLKTLEEPRGNAVLILISEHPEYLFSTILSRVQTVKFQPVEREEIKSYLKKQGAPEKESEEICQFSLGRPGLAIDFLSGSDKIKFQQQKIKDLIKISKSDLSERFQYAKRLAEESKDLKEVLSVWLNYFRNILFGGVENRGEYSLTKLSKILKLIQNTNFLISTTNVNTKLALENLVLEL